MVRTCSFNNKEYSVDMMIAYIDIFKPKSKLINIEPLLKFLHRKVWGQYKGKKYSPIEVIENPKKYKDDIKIIESQNMRYPIILDENKQIIDGSHRLAKAYLMGKKK